MTRPSHCSWRYLWTHFKVLKTVTTLLLMQPGTLLSEAVIVRPSTCCVVHNSKAMSSSVLVKKENTNWPSTWWGFRLVTRFLCTWTSGSFVSSSWSRTSLVVTGHTTWDSSSGTSIIWKTMTAGWIFVFLLPLFSPQWKLSCIVLVIIHQHLLFFKSSEFKASLSCCVRATSLLSSIWLSLSARRLHLSSSSLRASWVSARRFSTSMILRIFLRPLGVPLLSLVSPSPSSLSLCSNTEKIHKQHDH